MTGSIDSLALHVVGLPLKSLNVLLRLHWRKQRKYSEAVYLAMLSEMSKISSEERRCRPWFPGQVEIEVTLYYAVHAVDAEAKFAVLKPVLDALQKLGVITDDTEDVITHLEVVQEKVAHKAEQGFRVTVTGGVR